MSKITKTQQVIDWVNNNIKYNNYISHQRIPSVRQLAKQLKLSTFTVSQAYEQLVSIGVLRAIRGAGYYVNEKNNIIKSIDTPSLIDDVLDTGWLMAHIFNDVPKEQSPGSGVLPNEWLFDKTIIENSLRKLTKEITSFIYSYGHIQGFLPLRQQFALQLGEFGIKASPEQMITTTGVSSAIEMLARYFTKPGDVILVDDPSWFWLRGCLQQLGLKILAVPRNELGIDTIKLEEFLKKYRSRLYITNSVFHNPTGYNLSPPNIHKILNLLEKYDAYLLEDDVYSYFDNNPTNLRYATIDQLNRVFYVNGVSKILGGNWRVGLLCCPPQHLEGLLRQKMLSNMTCTELTERTIYHIWTHPHYKKHLIEIREKLMKPHQHIRKKIIAMGLTPPPNTGSGLFIWLDTKVNTTEMAIQAHKENWLLAPGELFSSSTQYTTYLRLNITRTTDKFLEWLGSYIAAHHSTTQIEGNTVR